VEGFIKERMRPEPGSIPALLGMFERELRFYREVAPKLGVRLPACYQAEETARGYRLVLEDLSTWREGADPMRIAALLADLHRRWEHRARERSLAPVCTRHLSVVRVMGSRGALRLCRHQGRLTGAHPDGCRYPKGASRAGVAADNSAFADLSGVQFKARR
jgi:hypothetical protein